MVRPSRLHCFGPEGILYFAASRILGSPELQEWVMAMEMPTRNRLLDGILIPRANGSEGLVRVENFIASTLEASGAEVERQPFAATPYGLQLVWIAALLLMIGSVTSILCGWNGAALILALAAPTLRG